MAACTLKLYIGDALERVFHAKNVCIIVNGHSSGIEPYGMAGRVYNIHPFGDVITTRRRLFNLERAIKEDRPPTGSVFLRRPYSFPEHTCPSIATCITQFGYGRPYDERDAKKILSKDQHFVQNLEKDVVQKRIENFKHCMEALTQEAIKKENKDLDLFLIQAGMGRGGRMDDVWLTSYLPIIEEFANHLKMYDIRVVLFIGENMEIPYHLNHLNRI